MSTTTANLGLTLPTPNVDTGWGGTLNTDFTLIDNLFTADGSGTSVGLQVGTGKTLNAGGTIIAGGTLILGSGDATGTVTAPVIRGAARTGTNAAGVNLTIDAANGTGTGGSGKIIFRTAPASGTPGTTANTMASVLEVNNAGAIAVSGANYGTSGQVLTSAGSGAATAWAAIPIPSGVLLRAPQVLTSGTSYTTPANCKAIYVEAVGGGGAGGGTPASGGNGFSGAGGGAGAYCAKYFTVTPSTSYTYAIGSGGTAAANTAGTAGGDTTFTVGATTITAGGGSGGGRTTGTTIGSWGTGGAGGTATNGDMNISGGSGGNGMGSATTVFGAIGGAGGVAFFGGAGTARLIDAAGQAGVAGSGGSGANCVSSGSSLAGGAGGAGLIRIWEFA